MPAMQRDRVSLNELTLRRTVIGGDTLDNDYCVIHEGRRIGRIREATERGGFNPGWSWHIDPRRCLSRHEAPAGRAERGDVKQPWVNIWPKTSRKDAKTTPGTGRKQAGDEKGLETG